MKHIILLCAFFLSVASGAAQENIPASLTPASPSWVPRPIVFSGPSLVGNGYQTLAGSLGGGFLLNSSKLLGDFEAYYMNAKKTNDNTVNNNIRTRALSSG